MKCSIAVIYMEGGNEDDLKILDEVKVAPEAAADTETIGETKAGQEEGEVTDDKVEEGELNEGKKDEFKVECCFGIILGFHFIHFYSPLITSILNYAYDSTLELYW